MNKSELKKILVWLKAKAANGYDPTVYRKDRHGWWIQYSEYGNRNSDYGWEIDHHIPSILGGGDSLRNLQPLHWKNNVAKSDSILSPSDFSTFLGNLPRFYSN